jgi:hypothetical protein
MWLLPSKDRPGHLERFFDACRSTGLSTPGLLLIDAKDYERHRQAYDALELPHDWRIIKTIGVTQGDKIREIWETARQGIGWLGLIGDDNVPETIAWDRRLVDALDGWNVGIVSCNDGWLAPNRVANCWVMSGELIRAVDYIFAPGMHHLFVDDLWETIGRDSSCWRVLMDVMVRHAHVMKGEAQPDATHQDVYGAGFTQKHHGPDLHNGLWKGDEEIYRAWLQGDRAVISAKIRSHRNEPARLKVAAKADPIVEARRKRAVSRRVMIGVPTARQPVFEFTVAFADTLVKLTQLGMAYETYFIIGSSNLPAARNKIAAKFLASRCTDLVFIDDDMGWNPDALLRLLASEQKVIAGVGRMKVDKPNSDPEVWCLHRKVAKDMSFPPQDSMGAVEVFAVGTAFMKVERCVFEQLIAAHPDWKRDGPPNMPADIRANYYQFFRFDPDDQREMGEDYVFCQRWRELGGSIWVDPEIVLSHVGSKAWTGALAETMLPAPVERLEAAE